MKHLAILAWLTDITRGLHSTWCGNVNIMYLPYLRSVYLDGTYKDGSLTNKRVSRILAVTVTTSLNGTRINIQLELYHIRLIVSTYSRRLKRAQIQLIHVTNDLKILTT